MNRTQILSTVCAILVLSAGAYWYIHMRAAPQQAPAGLLTPPVISTYEAPASLQVRHSVAGSTHTYAGTLAVQGCAAVSSGLGISGTGTGALTLILNLKVISQQCGSTPPPAAANFTVSFAPQAGLTATLGGVTVNGAPVPFTLVEQK